MALFLSCCFALPLEYLSALSSEQTRADFQWWWRLHNRVQETEQASIEVLLHRIDLQVIGIVPKGLVNFCGDVSEGPEASLYKESYSAGPVRRVDEL